MDTDNQQHEDVFVLTTELGVTIELHPRSFESEGQVLGMSLAINGLSVLLGLTFREAESLGRELVRISGETE